MTKTVKTVIAALAVILLGVMAYNHFAFADEREIQRMLHTMQKKYSAPMTGGLGTAIMASAIQPLLAPKVNITLRYSDDEVRQVFEQGEVIQSAIYIKQRNPELTVTLDFSRKDIQITEGRTATLSARVSVKNFEEPFTPRKITFTFEKNENGRWLLTAVSEAKHLLSSRIDSCRYESSRIDSLC
jgi:hypothetical protein